MVVEGGENTIKIKEEIKRERREEREKNKERIYREGGRALTLRLCESCSVCAIAFPYTVQIYSFLLMYL